MNENELIYAQVNIDGRCIDLLLTHDQIMEGFESGLSNPDKIPAFGQCWNINKPNKCSLLDRIMNRCCDCSSE